MSPNGSTALHRPASATALGMPQTTQVTSSWTTKVPPASAVTRTPASPSLPMPVSIVARVAAPKILTALRNSRSTDGRQ